jgi:hypothetical protein
MDLFRYGVRFGTQGQTLGKLGWDIKAAKVVGSEEDNFL